MKLDTIFRRGDLFFGVPEGKAPLSNAPLEDSKDALAILSDGKVIALIENATTAGETCAAVLVVPPNTAEPMPASKTLVAATMLLEI